MYEIITEKEAIPNIEEITHVSLMDEYFKKSSESVLDKNTGKTWKKPKNLLLIYSVDG